MRHFTTDSPEVSCPALGPLADGGYPVDGDLDQMTDDGCPLSPDPARWIDPQWQDSPDTPAAPANSRWQRLRDQAAVRERWHAAAFGS